MNRPIALHLHDVVFRYFESGKRNILDHVSLDIEEGTITVLMGGSGCGKSTLASVLAGLYPENGGFLESGTIKLFGHPVNELNTRERAYYLTLMFQNPDLQFCMDTLRSEMIFCMENICVPPQEMDARIVTAAKLFGMENKLEQKLTTLSGGEKQKAILACLFLMESKCILLDEAFANIDEASIRELIPHLCQMRSQGRTIVAIDHRLDYWLDVADEIILLGEGARVLKRGITPKNLALHEELFHREGLFYPIEQQRVHDSVVSSMAAIRLTDVAIPKLSEKSGKTPRTKTNDEFLLEDVYAEFPKGAMTAVLGASGSGKTTLFLSILKQHSYQGLIEINGKDIRRLKEKELFARVGIVFQNPGNQFISQNVRDEVEGSLCLWEKGLSEDICQEKTTTLLKDYGLERYHRYSPYMLSQGQQRRLAVLSILAGGQKIFLLDEPTYGQDYRSTRAIMAQLRHKVQEEGLTVIFITHDRLLAEAFADKIYFLENNTLTKKKQEVTQ